MVFSDLLDNGFVDDLNEFDEVPADAEVTYEVWALGYNSTDEITDTEVLLESFTVPENAVAYAKTVTLPMITAHLSDGKELGSDIEYFSIEVETVVETEDEGTMNVGTIYYNSIWVKGEDISLGSEDYQIDEEGNLKIPCKLLKDFNKNDYIDILFKEENERFILTYKIISKAIFADGDYYICEFIY